MFITCQSIAPNTFFESTTSLRFALGALPRALFKCQLLSLPSFYASHYVQPTRAGGTTAMLLPAPHLTFMASHDVQM